MAWTVSLPAFHRRAPHTFVEGMKKQENGRTSRCGGGGGRAAGSCEQRYAPRYGQSTFVATFFTSDHGPSPSPGRALAAEDGLGVVSAELLAQLTLPLMVIEGRAPAMANVLIDTIAAAHEEATRAKVVDRRKRNLCGQRCHGSYALGFRVHRALEPEVECDGAGRNEEGDDCEMGSTNNKTLGVSNGLRPTLEVGILGLIVRA